MTRRAAHAPGKEAGAFKLDPAGEDSERPRRTGRPGPAPQAGTDVAPTPAAVWGHPPVETRPAAAPARPARASAGGLFRWRAVSMQPPGRPRPDLPHGGGGLDLPRNTRTHTQWLYRLPFSSQKVAQPARRGCRRQSFSPPGPGLRASGSRDNR